MKRTNIGWQDQANPYKIALLDKYLAGKKGLQVLELAAGYGWYSKHLHHSGHTVKALDIDIQFEEPGIEIRKADLEKPVEFADGTCDVIVAWDIIEHLQNEPQIIAEMARIAKPGAVVFVSVPHADDSRIASSYLTYSHFKDNTHVREYLPQELSKKFEQAGFRTQEVKLQGGAIYPYIILNFIDNSFFKFCMRVQIRLLTALGIVKSGNCHGDIYAVFVK
jgi:2-polyprenyl-3-methyl-5-hydroxy-6-metoxy-1,4-benzoquinol methylase